jgi:cytochrome P450
LFDQFGKRIGFIESGGQDVDGIMKVLEDSTSFYTFGGLSSALMPVLSAAYGNPGRGITAFADKLHHERAGVDSELKTGGDTFLEKVERLREADPEGFEEYRLGTTTLSGNVAAGSDMTSISLTGALYRISTTKNVSGRMHDEIQSQYVSGDKRTTFEQAQQLPYLQMVIKEALRIHTAVGLPMWREVTGDGLDIDGIHFPSGVSSKSSVSPWKQS